MDQIQDLWDKVLEGVQKRVSKPSFETWLKETQALRLEDDTLIISVPNDFARDWLRDRYTNIICDVLRSILGKSIRVQFITAADNPYTTIGSVDKSSKINEIEEPELLPKATLNPRYTFDTFVIGSNNRFAHAASLAVSESPAKAYNPLFIYGGVGLGKTHLMHAIGHHVLEHNRNCRVVYISSEKFTNEFINAIRDNKTDLFRSKYRSADILLIDDIQFIAGKEQTQEEFFHTFNTLHDSNKQIIISSDRPPKDIPNLEDRMRSRFEWGLITDVQPPDYETRIAILRKKASADQLDVPSDVLAFIADRIDTNIRELEGALIRVMAYSALMNQPVSIDLAQEALKDLVPEAKMKIVGIPEIQQQVASYYRLRIEDLKSKKRTKSIAFPRQIAMYLSRELTDHSLPKIGEDFGGRDHTTVMHAYDKIKKSLPNDPDLQQAIDEIKKKLGRG